MNIMIVDSERCAVKTLKKYLSEICSGDEISTVSQADMAIEYARNNVIDVVFLTYRLHKVDTAVFVEKLKATNPSINIIFTAKSARYAIPAIILHASGYIVKPFSKKDVEKSLKNLLFPVKNAISRYFARTFGNFDFFVDGVPLKFKREKTKELLAYLVDRRGAVCSPREISVALWESDKLDYLRQLTKDLSETLKSVGAENIFVKKFKEYYIVPQLFDCDYYDFLAGKDSAKDAFRGEYMSQYSWAEDTLSSFGQF